MDVRGLGGSRSGINFAVRSLLFGRKGAFPEGGTLGQKMAPPKRTHESATRQRATSAQRSYCAGQGNSGEVEHVAGGTKDRRRGKVSSAQLGGPARPVGRKEAGGIAKHSFPRGSTTLGSQTSYAYEGQN